MDPFFYVALALAFAVPFGIGAALAFLSGLKSRICPYCGERGAEYDAERSSKGPSVSVWVNGRYEWKDRRWIWIPGRHPTLGAEAEAACYKCKFCGRVWYKTTGSDKVHETNPFDEQDAQLKSVPDNVWKDIARQSELYAREHGLTTGKREPEPKLAFAGTWVNKTSGLSSLKTIQISAQADLPCIKGQADHQEEVTAPQSYMDGKDLVVLWPEQFLYPQTRLTLVVGDLLIVKPPFPHRALRFLRTKSESASQVHD